jgi:DNA polymerase I-like protein with 3'-5' exonuclease and polymerase domains
MQSTSLKIVRWLDANPEIRTWWDDVVEQVRRDGFLAEPILGRRRDFLDGMDDLEETRSEIINFGPQSATAALINKATVAIVEGPIPFGKWGPNTGLVNQTHDSLLFEVPESKAVWAKEQVRDAMTQRFDCLPVWFTADAKVIVNGAFSPWVEVT